MTGTIEHHNSPPGESFKFQNPSMALAAINTIDSVIQITSDVNIVLDQLMDAVLGIFSSSRAWLFHPCNPKLNSFDVSFESTIPEYPGANALKQQVPMTDDMADYCRRALSAADGPEIDPPEGQPVTNDIAIRFNVKSMLFMALRPKSGEPWMLGLHQCDRNRIMMLERMGYKVLAAGTPGEAIALSREHAGDIHLLMTDVVMPEMNGRNLAKNLLSLYPNLKRLFMSGYTANVIAHHGVLDEGVHFIQKPFSKQDLAIKVREALDEAQEASLFT